MDAYFDFPNNEPAHKTRYNQTMGGYIDPSVQFLGKIKVGFGVIIERNVFFGGNNFVGWGAKIRPSCQIGFGSEVRHSAWLAPNCTVGKHSVIYNYANLAMGTRIGDYVYFGTRSTTTNADDIVLHRDRDFVPKPVSVEDGARVATHCCIGPGLVIGKNCLVGMGSIVTKDVPAQEIWFGNPARHRGFVHKNDVPSAWMDSVVDRVIREGG